MTSSRRHAAWAIRYAGVAAAVCLLALALLWAWPAPTLIRGMVWQPTLDHPLPSGQWQQLGADTLLIQWTAVDGRAMQPGLGIPAWNGAPDWRAIDGRDWSRERIVGLAGGFDTNAARRDWQALAEQSRRLAAHLPTPSRGWYAPVEISPDWRDSDAIRGYLARMPRPLSVSIYRDGTLTTAQYVAWVRSWLPDDVGVLFQDGVGTGQSGIEDAAAVASALGDALGPTRVAIIAEAFAPGTHGEFVRAPTTRLAAQLHRYRRLGLPIYVFSCHQLPTWQVLLLKLGAVLGLV